MATYDETKLELFELNTDDINSLIELSTSVGWDYDKYEICTVLSTGKIFGYKNALGKVVSCAAIISYDTNLASIGMVIVSKEFRGLGLGRVVTQKCIDSCSNDKTIMLIATEDGKILYEKMDFRTVNYVHKYLCDSYTNNLKLLTNSNVTIRAFNEIDMNRIVDLDKAAFGDKRSDFLKVRINQSEQCIEARDNSGNIMGYGISIGGPINLILGPIVAPDHETAALILDKLAFEHQGKLRIDVPTGNDQFMLYLEQSGFNKVSEPPIMVINSENLPPRNSTLFGIAAQIFG
ncbi:GNAT family N-acetyltransferase [Cytobacillus sp. IB215665]|uniref:GNAT family N-acetyltransferase n=1 Tax=Cytobacillus sp. IB215665 TaxID=3097357 RepID=UPI002A12D97C|nr:GNAT family N-acetyltransferase [Cytobacillus sp. IB215665]MDX8366065.1 GNAT family N-acetyltransferase [Cytobacillus sp. IB215665]